MALNTKLSIIIPIKISEFNVFLYNRLQRFLEYFIFNNWIECVVVDSTSSIEYKIAIEEIVAKYNANYIYIENKEPYSAAKSRNMGARLACGDYVIFYDIDLLAQKDFFFNILEAIDEIKCISPEAFTIFPCLYLTESFSRQLEDIITESESDDSHVAELSLKITNARLECLKGKKDKVLYPAINTSTILVNRKHFLKIGGYYEGFEGHGYEDFFLIHVLSYYYPLANKPEDYSLDYKTDYPGLYLGFRQYFAFYALENLFKGRYTVHLYHDRSKKRIYYFKRDQNSLLYQTKLDELGTKVINKEHIKYDNYHQFTREIVKKYGYSRKQISGFYRPYLDKGAVNRIYRTYRKARKLVLQPKAFFKDLRLDKYLY